MQFRVLYHDFLSRMVDLEILSTRGDIRDIIARCGGLLGGVSFVLAVLMVPHPHPMPGVLNDEEFLISTTIAVAGLFAVFAWDIVFPDRRECLILGSLPIPVGTIALAKLAAIATGLGAAVVMTNVFTGLSFPFVTGGIRAFPAWWVCLFAAGAFTFCAVLALRGIAGQILSWRSFLRVSGLLQLTALFLVLAWFFVTPPFALTIRNGSGWVNVLPSYWFTGLLEVLKGSPDPSLRPRAAIALRNFAIAAALAAATFALSYYRNMRRIIEAPDIAAPGLRGLTLAGNFLANSFFARPLDRAIVLFTARTLARSRQHRLLLAAYGGIGFALALAFSKSLLEGASRERWDEPNVPLLVAGAILVFSAVSGTRAVFVFPQALPANWIFRMTAVHSPAAYCRSVRKALLVLAAAPAWIVAAAAYSAIWPTRTALGHTAMLVVLGFLLVDKSLYQFRKIPFTCSWLPDGAQSKMRSLVYGILFILLASILGSIELWTMHRLARFVVLFAILTAVAIGAARRRAEFAEAPGNSLQFEDLPPSDIFALDLRPDGEWSGEQAYVDAIDANFGRSIPARLRPYAVGLLLLLFAGLVYEHLSEWRDRQRFPQIGRSVNIGGRSLNIYCSGQGGPTVVFESAFGAPGLEWRRIQQDVSKFARACWYDRAGLGWSDAAPHLNLSDSVARDLHALLRAAGVAPPYILVGHSRGGFHVRVYRAMYPNEVAGMVLVDSSHEDTNARIPNMPRQVPPLNIDPRVMVHVIGALGRVGLVRILAPDTPEFRWQALAAQINEGSERSSAAIVRTTAGFGDVPLIVLTAGKGRPDIQIPWIQLQKELAARSAHGKQIVVPDSGHDIPGERPDIVLDAIREVIQSVHAASSPVQASGEPSSTASTKFPTSG